MLTITTAQVTIDFYTPYVKYVRTNECCNRLALVIEMDIFLAS